VARKDSRVEYYLSIKRICLTILPHSDNSVFHTFFFVFFFLGGGGGFVITKYSLQTPIALSCLAGTTCPVSCYVSQMTSQGSE
jgi:hypothetical protein